MPIGRCARVSAILLGTLGLGLALTCSSPAVRAADDPAPSAQQPSPQDKRDADIRAAFDAADKVAIVGPNDVALLKQAVLHLPQGYTLIPQPEANAVSRALGNQSNPRLVAIVIASEKPSWMAFVDYASDGYVKDDDAKNWDAGDMLQSLKDGTESANADRIARGFEPLEVAKWIEPPAYDAVQHRLVWSALVHTKGAGDDEGSANYNTYALGREGHFELDLVSKAAAIEANKPAAKDLLAGITFLDGKRYQDFDAKSDHIAEYGLAALVGGIAAKKLGLIAVMTGFALKFAKLIALGVVAMGAGIKSLFKRKSS